MAVNTVLITLKAVHRFYLRLLPLTKEYWRCTFSALLDGGWGTAAKRSEPSRWRVKTARLRVQRAPRWAHYKFESPTWLGEVYTSETPNRMRGGVYISMRSPLRYIGISFSLSFEDRGLTFCVCTPGIRAHTTIGADFWILTIVMVILVKWSDRISETMRCV